MQCVIPWQTFIVRANGLVIPCSNGFVKGDHDNCVIGDANTQTLKEIWDSETFKNWRQRHIDWDFAGTICASCDRWKMGAVYDDEIRDGMRIKHTAIFEVYSRLEIEGEETSHVFG